MANAKYTLFSCSWLVLWSLQFTWAETCTPHSSNPCVCRGSNFTLDLRHYLDLPYQNIPNPNREGETFTYSPCSPMACAPGASATAAMCQYAEDMPYSLGQLSSFQWSVSTTTSFTVRYTNGDTGINKDGERVKKKTAVIFTQDKTVTRNMISFTTWDQTSLEYFFIVTGPSIGPVSQSGGSGGTAAGVIGLVLISLFLVAVVLYFVVGGVYLYRVRGARGWEVIPHHKLWKEFPFLVKDGCVWSFSSCRRCLNRNEYSTDI